MDKKDRQIKRRDDIIETQKEEIKKQKKLIEKQEKQMEKLTDSNSWKMTSPLRKVKNSFKK